MRSERSCCPARGPCKLEADRCAWSWPWSWSWFCWLAKQEARRRRAWTRQRASVVVVVVVVVWSGAVAQEWGGARCHLL
jgi:hypothetical protein